jgi:toxin ParE1/3/4
MKRRISWSERASADYHEQLGYIADQNPSNADIVDQRLMAAIELLSDLPVGRVGRVSGTYEKPVSRTSLIIAYQVTDDRLHTLSASFTASAIGRTGSGRKSHKHRSGGASHRWKRRAPKPKLRRRENETLALKRAWKSVSGRPHPALCAALSHFL